MIGLKKVISSVSTYPFHVFGGAWEACTPPHLDELPRKGDIVIGNDVWIGRNSVILPGVRIGDGAIIAAQSVVARDVPAYTVARGNPARHLKDRFDPQLTELLLRWKWWDLPSGQLLKSLPMLCSPEWERVRDTLRTELLSE